MVRAAAGTDRTGRAGGGDVYGSGQHPARRRQLLRGTAVTGRGLDHAGTRCLRSLTSAGSRSAVASYGRTRSAGAPRRCDPATKLAWTASSLRSTEDVGVVEELNVKKPVLEPKRIPGVGRSGPTSRPSAGRPCAPLKGSGPQWAAAQPSSAMVISEMTTRSRSMVISTSSKSLSNHSASSMSSSWRLSRTNPWDIARSTSAGVPVNPSVSVTVPVTRRPGPAQPQLVQDRVVGTAPAVQAGCLLAHGGHLGLEGFEV